MLIKQDTSPHELTCAKVVPALLHKCLATQSRVAVSLTTVAEMSVLVVYIIWTLSRGAKAVLCNVTLPTCCTACGAIRLDLTG